MTRATVILILGFFCFHGVSGQRSCKGILLDSMTREPVEFANIGIPGHGVGTVSDEKGAYTLLVPDSLAQETVRISMIGYKPRTFSLAQIETQSAVYLAQSITTLNEVSVAVKKSKTKVLGNDTRTRNVSGGFRNNSLGAEMAVKLDIRHPQTHLKKFMVHINSNSLGKAPVFRFNLYTPDKNGFPGENLLTQNIILEPKETTGLVELDLIPYNLFVDDDVFISLEWIKDLGDAKGLYFSTKLIGSTTYFRQASQDKWQKATPVGVGLHAEVAY
jgi:hypothetical protein